MNHSIHTFPTEVEEDDALPSSFNSQKWSFHNLFSIMFLTFLYFFSVVLLFEMVPKKRAEVLQLVIIKFTQTLAFLRFHD